MSAAAFLAYCWALSVISTAISVCIIRHTKGGA